MNKIRQLRQMPDKELIALLNENRSYLLALKYKHRISQVESPIRIRTLRREIARILTILRERNIKL
ncbi:MAG: 50S ribosomal protein L29 [Bacteroidia bacterium]|nr:50S ribosomal protein L29 [Bacteroidia bacterium]MDW8159383.1 50S ribosomal protein L29 [Bacteroidia bacterium]